MKNLLKATLGVLLFSGLLLFNLSDSSSNESSGLSTMSLEQTAVYADDHVCTDPHTTTNGYTFCYHVTSTDCYTGLPVEVVVPAW